MAHSTECINRIMIQTFDECDDEGRVTNATGKALTEEDISVAL